MFLRQMQYYVQVVECKNFTRAAKHFQISQPAISQQIQALEKELGVVLIHREHRSFSLTPAGEHLYRRSCALLREIDTMRSETIRLGKDEPRPTGH